MAVISNAELRGTALTPAGTTQSDAANVGRRHAQTDTSFTAGAGVILKELTCQQFEWGTLFNGASSVSGPALLVYPWSGASFNGQTANAALTLPAGSGCMWVYLNSTTIGIIYS